MVLYLSTDRLIKELADRQPDSRQPSAITTFVSLASSLASSTQALCSNENTSLPGATVPIDRWLQVRPTGEGSSLAPSRSQLVWAVETDTTTTTLPATSGSSGLTTCRCGAPVDALHLPPDLFLRLAEGIANGLAHLARHGIIHRDLASRNVLLDAELTPKICDLGLSVQTRSCRSRQSQKIGQNQIRDDLQSVGGGLEPAVGCDDPKAAKAEGFGGQEKGNLTKNEEKEKEEEEEEEEEGEEESEEKGDGEAAGYAFYYRILTANKELPFRILPPEALHEGRFLPASDVWQFGLLVWQMHQLDTQFAFGQVGDLDALKRLLATATASANSPGTSNGDGDGNGNGEGEGDGDVERWLTGASATCLLHRPVGMAQSAWQLIVDCLRLEPKCRPRAGDIARRLGEMMHRLEAGRQAVVSTAQEDNDDLAYPFRLGRSVSARQPSSPRAFRSATTPTLVVRGGSDNGSASESVCSVCQYMRNGHIRKDLDDGTTPSPTFPSKYVNI